MFGITSITRNNSKINVISKDNLTDADCSSPGESDEDMKITKFGAVSDTIWKIGCYKINPSTPNGNLLRVHKYCSNYLIITISWNY